MASKRVSENKVVLSGAAAVPARRKSATAKRVSRPSDLEISSTPVAPESEVLPTQSAALVAVSAESLPALSFKEAVARLAYSYWEARGFQGGSPEADWLRAEQELSAR